MTPEELAAIREWDTDTPPEYLELNTTYGLALRQRRALLEHIAELSLPQRGVEE